MKQEPPPGSVEPTIQVISVRGRPVGITRATYGASLVAVERGYFPMSHTGYWSLAGYGIGQPDPLLIKPGLLESLAEAKDRERKALLINLLRAVNAARGPRENFIHVSLYVDKAIDEGFFAPENERIQFWQAAHRLLCLVDVDPRFQPTPDRFAWGAKECERALANIRNLHTCLKRFAKGDYSGELPCPLFGAQAYAKLPPKPGGEAIVVLHGAAIEMSFNLNVEGRRPLPSPRTAPPIVKGSVDLLQQPAQLDLFSDEIQPIKTPRISA